MKEKYIGCLVGGAIGDALGLPVEFLKFNEIKRKYGDNGITDFDLNGEKALISDDTQMTLFTAAGLLDSNNITDVISLKYIKEAYKNWLYTQENPYKEIKNINTNIDILMNTPELFAARFPGNTCLTSIREGCNGTIHNNLNSSKGCGGVMRTSPVALYFKPTKKDDILISSSIATKAAALTHCHILGFTPSWALNYLLSLIIHFDNDIKCATRDLIYKLQTNLGHIHQVNPLINIIIKAFNLATDSDDSDYNNIRKLGEGWVAEETLAIAIYCAIKYQNDFSRGIIASVNHDGDSDSTGAVTGNILGAFLGIDNINSKWTDNLEMYNLVEDFALKLYNL